VLALAVLFVVVRAVPGLPDWGAGMVLAAVGMAVALPDAWAAAVRRGHGLAVLAAGGRLRPWLGGPAVRLGLAGAFGTLAAVLLVLRLLEASRALWLLAGLALPLTWGAMAVAGPRLAAEAAGPHGRVWTHLVARGLAVGVLVAAAAGLGLVAPQAPVPAVAVPAAPLVGEALVLARLWTGLEAFVLGQAAEFGAWGRGLAGLVAGAGLAGMFWALASLAVLLALPRAELGRALAPASADPVPPAPGRLGPVMVVALVALAGVAAGWAGARLGEMPPGARPSGQALVAAEMIGGVLHAAGTAERLVVLRAAALAEEAAARAALGEALDAGFAAMAGNVGTFLDDYYSLSGEYLRLIRWALGSLEDQLTAELTATLQRGAPFAGFEAELAAAMAAAEARVAGLAAAEAALLAQTRLEGANPARLRLTAEYPAPGPVALRLAADLAAAPVRLGVSAGAGLVAATLAQRVVAGLAARGLMGAAARMAVRAGGLILAFGLDYALVKLDEFQNREAFAAEILGALEDQRRTARAALGLP
jgi:hypothetical protein